jgi:hypothetical protein
MSLRKVAKEWKKQREKNRKDLAKVAKEWAKQRKKNKPWA